jgi:hypothetical protein
MKNRNNLNRKMQKKTNFTSQNLVLTKEEFPMKAKKNKKENRMLEASADLDRFATDPYFLKKVAEANEFLARVGLPPEIEKRQKA